MLRVMFIYLSKARWAQQFITRWKFARKAASRFVAGETLPDAIQVVRELNTQGMQATLDFLGEHVSTPEESTQAVNEILRALDQIHHHRVRANVSLKLSQLGLGLDGELCRQNLHTILDKARELGQFVRIDMEDSTMTQATIDTYEWARRQGFENVGIVIQAYLGRSEQDVLQIAGSGGRIRLCKGAYKEPPQIAFPKKGDVDANYDRLVDILIQKALAAGSVEISSDGVVPPIPAIATHDVRRIEFAKARMLAKELKKGALEFQMLYGIRRNLQNSLTKEGYLVRVYVPYGTHWYPYFMRRLAERPANLWFFVSNWVRK